MVQSIYNLPAHFVMMLVAIISSFLYASIRVDLIAHIHFHILVTIKLFGQFSSHGGFKGKQENLDAQ